MPLTAEPAKDLERLAARLIQDVHAPILPGSAELKQLVGRAWLMGAQHAANELAGVRSCRVCGCTDDDACQDGAGRACCWVAPNLCSHCLLRL